MATYLHYFETENDYNSARENNYVEPWVSATHLQTNYRVNYNKSEREKELGTPLTFEILSDGNITWNLHLNNNNLHPETEDTGVTTSFTIEYKKNDGEWTSITTSTGGTNISVVSGDTVQFRGDNATYFNSDNVGLPSYAFFNSTCQFKAKANIMSMINSTDFSTATTLQSAGTFVNLFFMCTGLTDAGDLLLPATTLADGCYSRMFSWCENLTTAPELPATTLVSYCYSGMFQGCTGLTTAPVLPATTLAQYCYSNMFSNCTSLTTAPVLPATTLADSCYSAMFCYCNNLTTAPELPATTLAQYCYSNMFEDCTGLTTAPVLPATTLAESCYERMFSFCESLTTAPVLPATTLAQSCYYYMFEDCTGLTTAPELLATTLAQSCYCYMFAGCTSLTTAPELPATTLAQSCYEGMFSNCTSLNYIKCLATDISANYCTYNWVSGVQTNSGTFVKNPSMSSWTTGSYGIPTNWTVQDA